MGYTHTHTLSFSFSTKPTHHKHSFTMVGGATTAVAATSEHQEIANSVKAAVDAKHGAGSEFTVTHTSTQVVAGTNFFFRVALGAGKFLHLRVHRALPHAGQEISLADSKEAAEADELN